MYISLCVVWGVSRPSYLGPLVSVNHVGALTQNSDQQLTVKRGVRIKVEYKRI